MSDLGYNLNLPPRHGPEADKTGSYEQVFMLHNPVIQPGDTLRLQQFVTGYGDIRYAKLVFYPPPEIFNSERSFVINGFRDEGGKLAWGGKKQPVHSKGFTSFLAGVGSDKHHAGWHVHTMFFDVHAPEPGMQPQIATETSQEYAPFDYQLVTNQDILPGKYSLEFHLTYFNGAAWKTSSKKVDFSVQNWYERNEGFVKTIGLFLAGVGVVRALYDFARWALSPFF